MTIAHINTHIAVALKLITSNASTTRFLNSSLGITIAGIKFQHEHIYNRQYHIQQPCRRDNGVVFRIPP